MRKFVCCILCLFILTGCNSFILEIKSSDPNQGKSSHGNGGLFARQVDNTFDFVSDLLGKEKNEVLSELGSEFKKVKEGPNKEYEGYKYEFPDLTVVFNNDEVYYLRLGNQIKINGAKSGMNFINITSLLGQKEPKRIWYGSLNRFKYCISYAIKDKKIDFISDDINGNDSVALVSLGKEDTLIVGNTGFKMDTELKNRANTFVKYVVSKQVSSKEDVHKEICTRSYSRRINQDRSLFYINKASLFSKLNDYLYLSSDTERFYLIVSIELPTEESSVFEHIWIKEDDENNWLVDDIHFDA